MNRNGNLIYKIGFWSSILFAVLGVLYAIGMVALLFAFPIPEWNGMKETADSFSTAYVNFYSLCQVAAFASAPIFVIMLCCIDVYTSQDKKVLSKISLCFGVIFAVLSSINYFVQFTSVRQSVLKGQLEGLDQFVQWNPSSAFYSINLLGWTLFLGLSTLFLAGVFSEEKRGKWIGRLFILNGITCVLGAVATVFEIMVYLAVYPLLMTLFITAASVLVGFTFKEKIHTPTGTVVGITP